MIIARATIIALALIEGFGMVFDGTRALWMATFVAASLTVESPASFNWFP